MSVIPSHLTDAELATCVDEYVRRTVAERDSDLEGSTVQVFISAYVYSYEDKYNIAHQVTVSKDNKEQKYVGNNVIEGVRRCIERVRQDLGIEVTKVMPMIAAPVIEDGEFSDVQF